VQGVWSQRLLVLVKPVDSRVARPHPTSDRADFRVRLQKAQRELDWRERLRKPPLRPCAAPARILRCPGPARVSSPLRRRHRSGRTPSAFRRTPTQLPGRATRRRAPARDRGTPPNPAWPRRGRLVYAPEVEPDQTPPRRRRCRTEGEPIKSTVQIRGLFHYARKNRCSGGRFAAGSPFYE